MKDEISLPYSQQPTTSLVAVEYSFAITCVIFLRLILILAYHLPLFLRGLSYPSEIFENIFYARSNSHIPFGCKLRLLFDSRFAEINTLKWRGSTTARLREMRVRIPPAVWMSVCCDCCVLSGRGLCDGPFTRPEESYRVLCV